MSAVSQISEISDHLYLSGANGLKADRIRKRKINCIVNATVEEPSMYMSGVDYLKIRVDDNPYAHLDMYFDMVADRVKANKERGGKTLIHCVAGVSRSASLVIVYLLKYEHMTLRQAYFHVKSIRPIIRPNVGFWRQMIDFEKKVLGKASVEMLPSKWVGEMVPDVYTEELKRSWAPQPSRFSTSRHNENQRPTHNLRSSSPSPRPHPRPSSAPQVSAYSIMGPPLKSKLKGNLFTSLYSSDFLFPRL